MNDNRSSMLLASLSTQFRCLFNQTYVCKGLKHFMALHSSKSKLSSLVYFSQFSNNFTSLCNVSCPTRNNNSSSLYQQQLRCLTRTNHNVKPITNVPVRYKSKKSKQVNKSSEDFEDTDSDSVGIKSQ